MGIITGIRKRGGLLIVAIGLAVFGFVVMDVVQNRNMAGSATRIGTVDGSSMEFNEMRNMEEILYQGSTADEYSKREYIWNYFMESTILNKEAEKSGLMVGKEELMDLQFGNNLSPIMRQRYGNPQTGQVDIQQLQAIKDQIKKGELQPNMAAFWAIQEKEIIKERLKDKLNSLFTKAVYTPNWLAEKIMADQAEPVTALYVKVPATYIGDTEVKLTDSDYQKYIDEHKSVYTNEKESRIISTVNISVLTSSTDTMNAKQAIMDKMVEFKAATNDSAFVLANNGTITNVYTKPDQLEEPLKSKISGLAVGDVFGPYIVGEEVKAAKLLGKTSVADSVKSRHILISAQTPEDFTKAEQRIDSAQAVILSKKASFADVAKAISMDPGSASKGGDLPYAPQGMMVKEFNDALFFNSTPGQLKKVKTQFGYHLIEILDKKTIGDAFGYKLAYIDTELVPSEETQNKYLAEAEKLINGVTDVAQLTEKLKTTPGLQLQKNFAVSKPDFTLQTVGPGQSARDIIKWAFESKRKVGDIATEPFPVQSTGKYYVEQYVIPVLTTIIPKGTASVAALKEELTPMVMAAKKIEMLVEKAKGVKSLEEMASKFSANIDTAQNVTFNQMQLPGIGRDPKILAAIYTTPVDQTSAVIGGANGVFMIKPIRKEKSPVQSTIENTKMFYTASTMQMYSGRLFDALRKKAKIEDNRGDIY